MDAQRNLEHVLRAAREVFGELGYGAPMEDVARRARVGVGTVYRRFPSKDVLVKRIATEETERLTAQAHVSLAQEKDPWEALARFLRYAVSTGAGRLLPPQVLRAGAKELTELRASGGDNALAGDTSALDGRSPYPHYVVGAVANHHALDSLPDDGVTAGAVTSEQVRTAADETGAAELLDAVGELVERARRTGTLRNGVTVADMLLVIATAAPSLSDAAQQAAASERVLEILLAGLRAGGHSGHGTSAP